MSNVQSYLQHLVETIGPRPASSDTERVAAEWIHSVFQSHGLAADIRDFEAPRSRSVAEATGYLMLVAGTALIGVARSGWLTWLLWAILALGAVGTYLSARGGQPLSILMPKGPSQNVVARYAPHSQRGERRRKVVLIAHYDTATPTLLEGTATAAAYRLMVRYSRYVSYAMPVLALVYVLPFGFLAPAERWVWYITLLVAMLPLALGLNALAQLALPRFSPGANSNASGVAAMLGVLDELVGEPRGGATGSETSRMARATSSFGSVSGLSGQMPPFGDDDLFMGVQPTASAGSDLPDDFAWAPSASSERFGDGAGGFDLELTPAVAAVPSPALPSYSHADGPSQRGSRDTKTSSFQTIEFAAIPEESQQTVSFAPVPSSVTPFGAQPAEGVLGPDVISVGEQAPAIQPMDFGDRASRRSIFDFLRRKPSGASEESGGFGGDRGRRAKRGGRHSASGESSGDWLGLSDGFDATSAGEEIGSWDNFQSDDSSGWKGGWAEGDPIEDSHFAEEEAARIRRKVAESATVSLDDKEIWFVATGAGLQGGAGMKALLEEYRDELRGATFINVDSVGAGQMYWLATEGVHGDAKASARLVSVAKRASRDTNMLAKAAKATGIATDATVAMRGGMKAFTITRLVDGARPTTASTTEDVITTVDSSAVAETAAYVSELVRQS